MRMPSFSNGVQENVIPQRRDISQSLSTTHQDDAEAPGLWNRQLPSYRTAVNADDQQHVQGIWPPSGVIKSDRRKATVVWMLLVIGYIGYLVSLAVNSRDMRSNPPVKIQVKEEAFKLPDVVFCPATGDGCDSDDPSECAMTMISKISALGGFVEDPENLPKTVAPTPAPTPAPMLAPGSRAPSSLEIPPTSDNIRFGNSTTPAPVMVPDIRVNVESEADPFCERILLSGLEIDWDRVATEEVRSLHASVYVLWSDEVTSGEEIPPSTRMLINMFLLDGDRNVSDAVVTARLPYSRVKIEGSAPFSFISNDVVVSSSQYVRLGENGQQGSPERTYTQVTTSGQHTVRLNSFVEKEYEGAFLYATFNINNFFYQSIEEVDPVDVWALLGSAGGMWEIVCVVFGLCFVAVATSGPDKKWGLKKPNGGDNRSGTCKKCLCCRREENPRGCLSFASKRC